MNSNFWKRVRAAFDLQEAGRTTPPQLSKHPALDRDEAMRRINLLAGRDLRALADELGVTVWKAGRKNKGWAGHVLERYLGLAPELAAGTGFRQLGFEISLTQARRRRHAARQGDDGDHDARSVGSNLESFCG
jgi:hypothetical protein